MATHFLSKIDSTVKNEEELACSPNGSIFSLVISNWCFILLSVIVQLFLEQKKMLKMGLTIAHFKRYIPQIEQEAVEYFERWGDSGQRGKEQRNAC